MLIWLWILKDILLIMIDIVARTENYYKNALVLAYLGDSVFSLRVREYLVKKYATKTKGLNKLANQVVCARAQAEFMNRIIDSLSDDEIDIVMRARNSHVNTIAKNSTHEEYSLATQFEALIGYWYLNGNEDKIDKVFNDYVKEKL